VSDLLRRRVSRRRALIAGTTGLAGSAALLASACDGDGGRAQPTFSSARDGGTLRFATSLPLSFGLDPHLERATGLAIFPKIYGYLFHVHPDDDSLILDHASAVEQPEPATTIVTLRGDVRFHAKAPANGRNVIAANAAGSILRYRNNPVVLIKPFHETVLDTAAALDDRTVWITTRRPYAYALSEIGHINAGAIIPRELVASSPDLSRDTAASGPFVAGDVDLTRSVRITRNDAYFGEGARAEAMEWVIAGDQAKLDAFRTGGVDVVACRNRSEADTAQSSADDVYVVRERSLSWLSIGLRVDRPPFVDDRVRRALDLAIDRRELLRRVTGGEGTLAGPVNPHLAGGFWSLPEEELERASGADRDVDERIEQARALLDAAGAAALRFTTQVPALPELLDVAAAVRDQLEAAGVEMKVQELEQLDWFVRFRAGDFEATLISHEPYETPDLPMRLYHSAGIDGVAGNNFGLRAPLLDSLIERAWGQAGRAQRQQDLLDAQRVVIGERPLLHLFAGNGFTAAHAYVHDLGADLPGSLARYAYRAWLSRDDA
jgi:peptide/nickel transport system substrate-binding protein